jgi:hypothetical protein
MKRIFPLLCCTWIALFFFSGAQAQVKVDSFNVDGIKHLRTYQVERSDSTAKEVITEKRYNQTGKLIFDGYVEQYWVNGQVKKRTLKQVKYLPAGMKEVLEIPLEGKPLLTRYDMNGRVTERKFLRPARALGMAEL